MREKLFYLGLGTLLTHELDAMSNHEWRLLPILEAMPDQTGMLVFVVLHVPLFAVLIACVASQRERIRTAARIAIGGFLILHACLHLWFSDDPRYEFASLLSNALIYGGAAFGAAYLALLKYRKAR